MIDIIIPFLHPELFFSLCFRRQKKLCFDLKYENFPTIGGSSQSYLVVFVNYHGHDSLLVLEMCCNNHI